MNLVERAPLSCSGLPLVAVQRVAVIEAESPPPAIICRSTRRDEQT
jgi:hypothetical protein